MLRGFCLLVGVGMLGYGAYMAWQTYDGYKKGRDEYNTMNDDFTVDPIEELGLQSETETEEIERPELSALRESGYLPDDAPARKKIRWSKLKETYPDIVAWVDIPGIKASYPVAQSKDNEYYLHRDMKGDYLFAGCIFMDFRSAPDMSDQNTLIYGHNMRDGSMFGRMKEFRENDLAKKEPYFWIYTPEKDFLCRIFSVHDVGYASDTYKVTFRDGDSINLYYADHARETNQDGETEAQEELITYEDWLAKQIDASVVKLSPVPDKDKRIVTLSTCMNDAANRRVVQGFIGWELQPKEN